jgi:hypothetical protein
MARSARHGYRDGVHRRRLLGKDARREVAHKNAPEKIRRRSLQDLAGRQKHSLKSNSTPVRMPECSV